MVESLVVDEWIYDTLTADATLQDLLAVDNRAPNYQQGIYLYMAPEKDPISLRQPQVPYIVVRHTDGGQEDTQSMCGGRIVTSSVHQVWCWDTQSGAVSMARIKGIVDRIDTLLNKQSVNTTTPVFFLNRTSVNSSVDVSQDGRVDNGISLVFVATITLEV
jgi:hypothetical protein